MHIVTVTLRLPPNPSASDFAIALALASAEKSLSGDVFGASLVAQLGQVAQVAAAYSMHPST